MKFYLIAGERSGDLHAGNLIKSIKRLQPEAVFRGFGGDDMKAAGMELIVHYQSMAFMGFAEVIANLNTISKRLKQCKEDILYYKPDVIVLIDYAGFNMRIAKFAKANGLKVFWYISPKVWAWNQNRAIKLRTNIDRMFVILPFEKDFFKKFNWEVDYVGNPVLDAVKAHRKDEKFLERNTIEKEKPKPLIALLPGSRKQELIRIVPLMAAVVLQCPHYHFVVATVSNLQSDLYKPLRSLPNVTFIEGATYDLLSYATAAIVTSGTATLETALFKVPQVVVYKAGTISYLIAKSLIRVPFISLVNLIVQRAVVKEFIQDDANQATVTNELAQLVSEGNYRKSVLKGYDEIIKILDTGSASENAARLMVQYLKN